MYMIGRHFGWKVLYLIHTKKTIAKYEGILPALESSHAVFRAMEQARRMTKDERVLICLSGRGDKDAAEIARLKSAL